MRFRSERQRTEAGHQTRDSDARALARGVQSFAALLVVDASTGQIVHASANCEAILGIPGHRLLQGSLDLLGTDVAATIEQALAAGPVQRAVTHHVTVGQGAAARPLQIHLQQSESGVLFIEVEPLGRDGDVAPDLAAELTRTVTECALAHSFSALGEMVAGAVRRLTGLDQVLVCRFDEAEHGSIIAEAKREGRESYLARRYPATDLPPRVRRRFLHRRIRYIADTESRSIPIEGAAGAVALDGLAAQACIASAPDTLRTLASLGVTTAVYAALVHDGRLWGLIIGHHREPLAIGPTVRAAIAVIAEVASTRVSALEHFAEAQAEVLVRRLEQRLIEASATDGDWRRVLFEAPRQLLQPVGASGAALMFDGEVQTTGDVPAASELRALFAYLERHPPAPVFATASIAQLDPSLQHLSGVAAGILAVRLAPTSCECLVWFRREQLQDVTWGGSAYRPLRLADSADHSLSSAASTWHEEVHQTAIPWTQREISIAKAVGASLADIALQIRAVRVLIAEAQLRGMREAVVTAADPVVIADADGRILLANDAFAALLHGPFRALETVEDLASRFETPERVLDLFDRLRVEQRAWRGELRLLRPDGTPSIPVALRADPIPHRNGGLFGFIVILNDLTSQHAADAARDRLQRMVEEAQGPRSPMRAPDGAETTPAGRALAAAIWANAGVAISEIADSADPDAIAPLLLEIEAASRHAAELSALLSRHAR